MVNNHLRYFDISKDHLARAGDTLFSWRSMPIGQDFPQSSDNLRYLKAISSIYTDCLISLTFSALLVEALANLFGEVNLGMKYFYEHLDKLETKSKLQVVSRLIGCPEIDKSTKLWSDLVYLFKTRNEIVHHKSLPDERWTCDPEAEYGRAMRCHQAAVAIAEHVYNGKQGKIFGPFTKTSQSDNATESTKNANPT